jgi:hypothetical protein
VEADNMLLLSAGMRGDNIPHSIYLNRLAIENDTIAVRHEGDASAAWGKLRTPSGGWRKDE